MKTAVIKDNNYEDEDIMAEHGKAEKIIYKERRFTYMTELARFLENDIVKIHLHYMEPEKMILNSDFLNKSIYYFLLRIT